MSEKLSVDWYAGASASIELFRALEDSAPDEYQLKYIPAFRSTIRPPLQRKPLGFDELRPIQDELKTLATLLNTLRARDGTHDGAPAPGVSSKVEDRLKELGELLFDATMSKSVRADLRLPNMFIEFGMDESLLPYPWELMHDGQNFLCLQHFLGRFVNGRRPPVESMRDNDWWDKPFEKLKLLLICVPSPEVRMPDESAYDTIHEAEVEAQAIIDAVGDAVEVKLLKDHKAMRNTVLKELGGQYHIVHFCGHARFDDADPGKSCIVVFDEEITMTWVARKIAKGKPILCFLNACETSRVDIESSPQRELGLMQPFLDTGTYMLGTRWKVGDAPAAAFAAAFYDHWLLKSESLGYAVREGRKASRQAAGPGDFGWASYVLYGDPRVCFKRTS